MRFSTTTRRRSAWYYGALSVAILLLYVLGTLHSSSQLIPTNNNNKEGLLIASVDTQGENITRSKIQQTAAELTHGKYKHQHNVESSSSLFSTFSTLQHLPRGPTEPDNDNNNNNKSNNDNNSCSRILLYASSMLDPNGIGAQLNTYMIAVLTAVATDRKLVLLHRHRKSFFGCRSAPTEQPKNMTYPGGLSRLVHTPVWLTGGCGLPCGRGTLEWLARRQKDNYTNVTCHDNNNSSSSSNVVSVLLMGGHRSREYFTQIVLPTVQKNPTLLLDWARRLGASTAEVMQLQTILPPQNDNNNSSQTASLHMVAFLTRAGLIRLQPWIAKDLQHFYRSRQQQLPAGRPYVGIHVRRGDKLLVEARPWVIDYWNQQGYTDESKFPTNYIPFSAYLNKLLEEYWNKRSKDDATIPTDIYVATDDPMTIQQEIAALGGNNSNNNDTRLRFWFNPIPTVGHLRDAKTCADKYNQTLSALLDLVLLVRSDIFVGDYNSNWGRLVRTLRTTFVGNGTNRPVVRVRDVLSLFGKQQETWPR